MARRVVDREGWLRAARGGRLVALWGSERGERGFAVSAAYARKTGLDWVELPLGSATATAASCFASSSRITTA